MLIRAFLWGNDLKAFPLLKSAIFAFPHECHLKPTTTTTTWNSKQKLKSAIFCFFYQSFLWKQEAWPCIPVQSRNYLCAQNGNDNLMRSLKDAKMEVNGSGGRLDRKTSKEKSVKKGKRQKEKGHCRRRETGQTTGKEVWFYMFGRACPVWRIKSFFPVCLPCVTACSIHGSGGQTRLSAYGSKEQQKRKIVRNP